MVCKGVQIACKVAEALDLCLNHMMDFLELEVDYLQNETLISLKGQ